MPENSSNYQRRKQQFARCLTLFGRKPVLEALQHPAVRCVRLHFATSNKAAPILDELEQLARQHGAEINHHERQALARISRNGRQDQGVAADIEWEGYQELDVWLNHPRDASAPLIALDRIHNPQNLGMLIRATTAGRVAGLLLPRQGCCEVDGLVIKASAGTLFRSTLLRCEELADGLDACRAQGYRICVLDARAKQSLFEYHSAEPAVMVLGNETDGVSPASLTRADTRLAIPLANGVESLNLAVTGALIAFRQVLVSRDGN